MFALHTVQRQRFRDRLGLMLASISITGGGGGGGGGRVDAEALIHSKKRLRIQFLIS